jgi:RNA polymerase sigma factor (sigma-70 family)
MTSVEHDALTLLALEARDCPRALERLLSTLTERVRSMVFREIEGTRRHLSRDECDDVVQEVLIAVWTKDLHRFDPERASFAAFIRRRVSWGVGDVLRKRGRQRSTSLEAATESDTIAEPVAVGQDPVSLARDAERELTLLVLPTLVERELDEMGDDAARTAILSHDVAQRPLREVAATLGVHASNATRARQRGLRYLERSLPAAVRVAA